MGDVYEWHAYLFLTPPILKSQISGTQVCDRYSDSLQAGRYGFWIPGGVIGFVIFHNHPARLLCPLILLSSGYRGSFHGKGAGREVDDWSTYSAKVMNEWRYTSTATICFHDLERDNSTFTFSWTVKISFITRASLIHIAMYLPIEPPLICIM